MLRTALMNALFLLIALATGARAADETKLLYVAAPGVRDYLEYGGAGILVFDIEHGHKFVRRIETPASQSQKPAVSASSSSASAVPDNCLRTWRV